MKRKPVVVILKSAPVPRKRDSLPRDSHDYTPKQQQSPLTVAKLWLGGRLTERPEGYFLDGTPVNLDTIMRATNRLLQAQGVEMITKSPRWIP